ncbi:MAG: hypothetical protein AAF960_01300 [Bacteroidota bacterium]
MKKPLFLPIAVIVASAISYLLYLYVGDGALQVKLGFLSKVGLIIGFVMLWLFIALGKNKKA